MISVVQQKLNESTLSIKSVFPVVLLALVSLGLFTYVPDPLSYKAWSLTVIFLITLTLAIYKTFSTGVVAFIAMSLTLVTGTLSLDQCLSKFNHHVSWLILMAFFISRGIISVVWLRELLTT